MFGDPFCNDQGLKLCKKWLMGEGVQMSGKKEHGNKKVWNREEQV